MYLSSDIYEYLLVFLDDVSVINMLSVNKKFNNDVYYERIIRKRYPLLMIFKKKSWKNLFVEMSQHIQFLKKNYDIPYIPTKGYNPKYLIIYTNKQAIYECALYWAAEGGHIGIVKHIVEKGAKGFNVAMGWAASGGCMDVIRFMIEKGVSEYNTGLLRATEAGHLKVVKFMIDQGATDIAKALEKAKEKGKNPDIISFLKSKM